MNRILILVHPKWFGTEPNCKNCLVTPILVQKLKITRFMLFYKHKIERLVAPQSLVDCQEVSQLCAMDAWWTLIVHKLKFGLVSRSTIVDL
jgi:hypothetical protein